MLAQPNSSLAYRLAFVISSQKHLDTLSFSSCVCRGIHCLSTVATAVEQSQEENRGDKEHAQTRKRITTNTDIEGKKKRNPMENGNRMDKGKRKTREK